MAGAQGLCLGLLGPSLFRRGSALLQTAALLLSIGLFFLFPIATLLWLLISIGFKFYVANFTSYNATYGTIGGVIVLLTWMYYSMFVLLVGGELAAELHHGTGAIEPTKGALYYGRIVSDSGPGTPSLTKSNRGW